MVQFHYKVADVTLQQVLREKKLCHGPSSKKKTLKTLKAAVAAAQFPEFILPILEIIHLLGKAV